MELLGMQACIVPPNPGNLSAFGLLAVDWRTDRIATKVMHEDGADAAAIARLYGAMEHDAAGTLLRDGIARDHIRLLREADIRYAGQSMEVRVAAPAGEIGADFAARLAEAFHAAHRHLFGYDYAGRQKVELVNFCVSGFGLIEHPTLPILGPSQDLARPRTTRPVYFTGGFRETPVYDRTALSVGCRLTGPAVIEEFGSTTVVFPDQQADVDPHGILVLRPAKS
jgi:N-methylhydantoinase A